MRALKKKSRVDEITESKKRIIYIKVASIFFYLIFLASCLVLLDDGTVFIKHFVVVSRARVPGDKKKTNSFIHS